jgi:hypothetical protein
MNANKIIAIMGSIIGSLLLIIVSVVGWIAVQVWDMNPKITETAHRVDRIVDVLPDVKIRIAQEDLQKSIRVALVTTGAIQTPSGDWIADVHLLDFVSGKRQTFKARLKGPEDISTAYIVSGLAYGTAREKLSFAEFSYAAMQIGKPLTSPPYLDDTASYAILKSSVKYDQQLRRLLGNPVAEADIQKKLLKFDQLIEYLRQQELTYGPKD